VQKKAAGGKHEAHGPRLAGKFQSPCERMFAIRTWEDLLLFMFTKGFALALAIFFGPSGHVLSSMIRSAESAA
jgi:hypothetical protein